MSNSGTVAARDKGRSSAHLGATLRSVLIAPEAGFRAALRSTERRHKKGIRPAEGFSPSVLSALGGASLMVLWLKGAALAGLRDGSAADYRVSFLIAALVLGAALGLVAQSLWGLLARPLSGGEELTPSGARLVWGAALFPHVFTLLLLLPIDLLVTGPSAFTEARPDDSVGAGWAALSLAIGVALALWSVGLFVKGLAVASGGGLRGAALKAVTGIACLVAVGVAFRFGLVALSEALS